MKVIYHANCSDGFCCAYLLWKKYGAADFVPMNYGEELDFDNIDGEDIVYIVDFSFSKDILLKLGKRANRVIVLDHHKTAQEELKPEYFENTNIEVHFDMTKSGAMMTWDYLQGDPYIAIAPLFVKYVQDRDLWKFELPNSRALSEYVKAVEFDFGRWEKLEWEIDNHFGDCIIKGTAIKMAIDNQVAISVSHGKEYKLLVVQENYRSKIYTIKAVNETVNFSQVAGALAEGYPFGLCWFLRSDGVYQYSLRSNENGIDVSEVARSFGGGGHARAAGFEADTLLLTEINK